MHPAPAPEEDLAHPAPVPEDDSSLSLNSGIGAGREVNTGYGIRFLIPEMGETFLQRQRIENLDCIEIPSFSSRPD